MEQEAKFDTWAIVEVMGHVTLAGYVTEQAIAGGAFIRIDVPEQDGHQAFTRFYGASAIYSITPVSEELARAALAHLRPRPVNVYLLPSPRDEAEW